MNLFGYKFGNTAENIQGMYFLKSSTNCIYFLAFLYKHKINNISLRIYKQLKIKSPLANKTGKTRLKSISITSAHMKMNQLKLARNARGNES